MIKTNVSDKLALHRVCLELVRSVWKRIEWDKVSPSRRMKIYEELNSKIKSAATTSKIERFIEGLAKKFDVRDIGSSARVLQIVEQFDEKKLLKTLREDTQIVILLLKEKQMEEREERAVMTPPADFLKDKSLEGGKVEEGGLFDNE